MNNLAIIPARSGSKRLKDKNILPLCGKPLLAYSIEAALVSGAFDEVMVSTDSADYAQIALKYGASVPFLRSSAASSDAASSNDMIAEVLDWYRGQGEQFDTYCLLQPTSPLRTAEDIKGAYGLLAEKNADAVVSVCEAEHTPLWCGHLSDELELDGFLDRGRLARDKRVFYRLNGAIYIVKTARFQKNQFLYRKGSYAYIMDRERSIDIDTELDFKMAEFFVGGGYKLTVVSLVQDWVSFWFSPSAVRVPQGRCA